jgi:hypothetical protein
VTGLTYEDLVAAATVGLSQRPLQITGLSGAADEHAGLLDPGDQAAALLDAAALLVTARRAGARPVPGLAIVEAAPDDCAPELPDRAADLLRAAGPALLAHLLGLAADHGYRAPAPLLPVLLDAAARDRGLVTAVARVLGARGRWLAGKRPDWQRVAGATPPAASISGDPGLWQTGDRAQRRAHLAALRTRDPAAARELLADGWSRETGDDRAALLAVLARGLSPEDEEFLETALDDRKASVRAEAARLLARLPGSAFTGRAAKRAAPLLRLEGHGPSRRLVASLPGGLDAAALRDGLSPGPRLFTETIAAAPLDVWASEFGMRAGEVVSLPVAGDLAVVVRAGWRQAAIRQADAQWAQALLGAGWPGPVRGRPPATWPPDHELAAVLSPDARAARAASLLAAGPNADAVAEVGGCPAPWPDPLAGAVVAALRQAVAAAVRSAAPARQAPAAQPAAGPQPAPGTQPALGTQPVPAFAPPMPLAPASLPARPGWPAQLAAAAALGLPATGPADYGPADDGPADYGAADYGAALAGLAATENCPAAWASALRRAAQAIAVRRAFTKEIR